MVTRWDAEVACPVCQGRVQKLMSTFAVGASHKNPLDGVPDVRPKMCTHC